MSKRSTAATASRSAAARSAGTGSVSQRQRRNGPGRAGASPRTIAFSLGIVQPHSAPDALDLVRVLRPLLCLEEGQDVGGSLDEILGHFVAPPGVHLVHEFEVGLAQVLLAARKL